MTTDVLYRGLESGAGHFSDVNFTNLMEYALGHEILNYIPFGIRDDNGNSGLFNSQVSIWLYTLDDGVQIFQSTRGLRSEQPRRFVALRGPAPAVSEVKKTIMHIIETVDYNNEP